MLESPSLEELFDKLTEKDQDELLKGYKEAFPGWNKAGLLSAMVDNAADSVEVECRHLKWILSHLAPEEFLVERRAVEKYDEETSI